MAEKVSKGLIVLARESRGFSQLEVSNRVGMSQQNMGKIESGDIGIKDETLGQIAEITNYPISFFRQENEVYPEHLVYRRRDKVSAGLLTPINARVNIIRFHVEHLLKVLPVSKPELPLFEVSEKNTPQAIAQKVRKTWQINTPVIPNVVKLLEDNGIAIACFDFGTERVDSRCIITDAKYPVIIFNKTLLGDRQRFSLAYQLGHLLMHTAFKVDWERDIAHEANLFAAEFLMPENEIRKDFEAGITLPLLAHLKTKWKASMISLLYRADDLGFLTPNQKRYLIQQFNEQKLRRREPVELDIDIERPELIRRWISEVKSKQKLDTNGIAALLHLHTDEFIEIYG
ncbi:XRE family transcriptional regulator [Nemorincola caseinilytica]|uniref:XRE family transcriptional regulator n=1 Tax=Nemorincola caseinilytica TaxID=2054315 RepID=A0ABP8NMI7_9BACT